MLAFMKRLLPPNLAMICIATMLVLHWFAPGTQLLSTPGRLAGLLPLFAGLALATAGSRRFAREGTNIKTFDRPDVLVTDGLFRFSRNPMYVGLTLFLLGVALVLGSVTPLVVAALFFVACDRWYVPFEERLALETFGEPYAAYKERTRRWI